MNKTGGQKVKLLLLMEILRQDSDLEHPLRTGQLLERLSQRGISCDRRTLARDIADLNAQGFEVMRCMCGHEKGYYVDDRSFSVPELRILIDAIQAASFLTAQKTDQLTQKLAALGGSHRAELLQHNTVHFNTRKHTNETVYYTIDTVEEAIGKGQQISFLYFDLDEHRRRIYRHQGQRYQVEPVDLVLNGERYYLMALSPDRPGISTYRIDRMERAQVEEAPLSPAALEARAVLPGKVSQMFKMFAGPSRTVGLRFPRSLLGAIYDRFGEDVGVETDGEDHCIARATVQISPTFWGWLFQFGGAMELTCPQDVVDQSKVVLSRITEGNMSDL